MRRLKPSRLALAALVAALLPSACRQIIGIETGEPIVDTSTTSAGSGGSGAGGTDGGGGQASGGHDAGPDADAGPLPLDCTSYCALVKTACPDPATVYPSDEACLQLCLLLDLGTVTDMDKNTLGCRFALAENIAQIGELDDCPAVGPGGNDRCGSNCQSFCSLMEKVCVGTYPDTPTCLADCATVPDNHDYHVTGAGLPNDYSIQCRLRHVNSAAVDNPQVHCMHAIGIGKCGVPMDGGTDGGDAGDGG